MTEEEWLACTDPGPMLALVGAGASDRKLRLFACACLRRVWDLLKDPRGRAAVEVAERFADGLAGRQELALAWHAVRQPREAGDVAQVYLLGVAERVAEERAGAGAGDVARAVVQAVGNNESAAATAAAAREAFGRLKASRAWTEPLFSFRAWQEATVAAITASARHIQEAWDDIRTREQGAQAEFLRDLFGPSPFRRPAVGSDVLTWNDACVRKLAESVYAEQAWDRLPVLADALEEAGCSDADILSHCRGPEPHVRGCWVVDLVLAKSQVGGI